MKGFKIKYALIPLFVLIIAVVGISQIGLFNSDKVQDLSENGRWKIKKVYTNSMIEDTIAVAPRWDEMTICQQFSFVKYNGVNYDCKYGEVPSNMIGESLGSATLTGKDVYTDKTYTKKASLYVINTISQECAIALQFEGTTEYYAYINSYYRPETLGNFINDLNLKEFISFGSVWYDYEYTDEKGKLQFESIEFPNVDDETIWSMLFSDTSLENVYTDNFSYQSIMEISVDIPILGYKNISCSVTEEGYLVTNILDTGKAFYIGKEKVQEFVNYIINNYEGFKIVYVNEDGNEISENIEDDVTNNMKDDVVVTTQNNVTSSNSATANNNVTGGDNVIVKNVTVDNVIELRGN